MTIEVDVEIVREPNILVQVWDGDNLKSEEMVPLVKSEEMVPSDPTFDGKGLMEKWKRSKEPYAPEVTAKIKAMLEKEGILHNPEDE